MVDSAQPTATRRGMGFTDAVFDGVARWRGVEALRVAELAALDSLLARRDVVLVHVGDVDAVLPLCHFDVLVDARMRKRAHPEPQLHLADLTIGIGPNFVAGESAHLVVESAYGPDLGRVYDHGGTRPLAGEPREIEGHARDRYVYAPVAGVLRTSLNVGDLVSEGQVVATVDGEELRAPLSGKLRGLTHDDVPVRVGTKVIEVDPRGERADVTGVAERPAKIAVGVRESVLAWARRLAAVE
jgi:xanthine dehydrogenase accessory factor